MTNRWTPAKGDTAYGLDAVGNATNIFYAALNYNQSFAFNLLDDLISMQDLTGLTRFTRDPAGRILTESNAWTVLSRSYTNGQRASLTITQTGTNWTQSYAYDRSWRLTNTVSSTAGGFLYQFFRASLQVQKISLPNGAYITNSFDPLARLKSTALADHWNHVLDGYTYAVDALGMRTNVLRDLGLTRSSVNVGYDNIRQIVSWAGQETNGTPRLNEQLGLAYDAANNVLRRTNNLLVQSFSVNAADELNGLTRSGTFTEIGATPAPANSVTVNGSAAQTYGDFTFARTNQTLIDGVNKFTNVAVNAYGVTVTNTVTLALPVNTTLLRDANGNLTNDGVRAFGWDAENQLTNVTVAGAWKKDFVFDGLNRMRIRWDYIWTNSAWLKTNETRFVWDGYVMVQLRDSNNVPTLTLTRGLDVSGSLQAAGGIGGLLAMSDAGGTLFYHHDGSGNVTALMDGYENVLGRREYDAFGKSIFYGGRRASSNPFWFSGQFYDEGTRLSHYQRRAYAPEFSRWLNNDPIRELGGRNLMRFNYNNPLAFIDPFGLEPGYGNPVSGPDGPVGNSTPTTPQIIYPEPSGPPPITLPPGKNGEPNEWVKKPGSGPRGCRWGPKYPISSPKGGQPSSSWDGPNGHYDYDDGSGKRGRVLPDGTPVDHNNRPLRPPTPTTPPEPAPGPRAVPPPSWLDFPIPFPMFMFPWQDPDYGKNNMA